VLPRLFSAGPFTVYSYGALIALGFALGLLYARSRAGRLGVDPARILDLGVILILSAIVGAKLLLLVQELPTVLRQPGQLIPLLRAGGVFYGGLLAACGVGIWYLRHYRLPLWTTCDVFGPPIALGHVVGRLGCLAAGCCWGRPTMMPWGITFHDHFAASYVGTPLGIAVHPTQLYEAGAEALILLALVASERRGRGFPGRTFWLYLALYAVSRFVIEFFRGDERGSLLGVSTSQAISLVVLPCSVAALALLSRRGRQQPDAAGPTHGRTAPAHR
jgi:phosphatidylglycerol---prolipoprotein diacylglyceryl transferase